MRLPSPLVTLICLSVIPTASASDWGDLKGRFVFDGDLPQVRTIKIDKDAVALGREVKNESLLVNKKNKGIENFVIYLVPKKDVKVPEHPSYAKTAKIEVELKFSKGRIHPHMLLVRTSQSMTYTNLDPVAHHPHFFLTKSHSF